MTTSPDAYVTPEVLRWARESMGYSVVDAAKEIGIRWHQLEMAEEGHDYLTLRTAERAADVYERPLAALFLPEPPREEPPEVQFRRLPGAPRLPWPPAMHGLARRVRRRQEAAEELYEALDEQPQWPSVRATLLRNAREAPAASLRAALGISIAEQTNWRDRRGYLPLRVWTDAVEALGVLVMQDGGLPVDEMRGFASLHETVPAVVINSRDDARARVFSLMHELAHLLLRESDQRDTESRCSRIAGELLMPREELAGLLGPTAVRRGLPRLMDEIALHFGVTPYAAAVRVSESRLLPADEIGPAIAAIQRRRRRGPVGTRGGDYYRKQLGRLGPAYTGLVLSALDGQALTYPEASRLLGVKVNRLPTLREYLDRRAVPA